VESGTSPYIDISNKNTTDLSQKTSSSNLFKNSVISTYLRDPFNQKKNSLEEESPQLFNYLKTNGGRAQSLMQDRTMQTGEDEEETITNMVTRKTKALPIK